MNARTIRRRVLGSALAATFAVGGFVPVAATSASAAPATSVRSTAYASGTWHFYTTFESYSDCLAWRQIWDSWGYRGYCTQNNIPDFWDLYLRY
ncbi:hypothetical protein GCM10009682_00320 [Luedemannella flava]|uniref:Uncharacterized protein n=1 Tax=Luedemannella flava TaxID=349316 RepID=A0ABP4XIH2_9ACTN